MPAILSALRQGCIFSKHITRNSLQLGHRGMGGGPKTMNITPSRWQWHKFKDMLHFYVMLGAIPLSLVTLYINIFVGPAKLAPIPEGYDPKPHEYYRHPITRWICKYFTHIYQEEYEKRLCVMFIEDEKTQMRLIEQRVLESIKKNEDVRGYTFIPILTKYHKNVRDDFQSRPHTWGDN